MRSKIVIGITVLAAIIMIACMVGFETSYFLFIPMFVSAAWLFAFGFANSEEWRNQE